jgi:hypothetical protein
MAEGDSLRKVKAGGNTGLHVVQGLCGRRTCSHGKLVALAKIVAVSGDEINFGVSAAGCPQP